MTSPRHPIRAFVALTSRTPHFRREDVADRLLILRVQRYEEFVPESKILAELDKNRDLIMTEVVKQLQVIVRALEDQKDVSFKTGFRMADFADFSLKVAHYQGWGDRMKSILEKLSSEQTALVMEDEECVDLIEYWLQDERNIGREITATDLCKELAALASNKGIDFTFKENPRSFASRLRNIRTTLNEFFIISERTADGRRKLYAFKPKVVETSEWEEDSNDF